MFIDISIHSEHININFCDLPISRNYPLDGQESALYGSRGADNGTLGDMGWGPDRCAQSVCCDWAESRPIEVVADTEL